MPTLLFYGYLVTLGHKTAWYCRMAYVSFSLVQIPPLGFLGVSKPFYHGYHVGPVCDKTFLFVMRTKVNLVDPSEDSG